jgi:hypothetical protein
MQTALEWYDSQVNDPDKPNARKQTHVSYGTFTREVEDGKGTTMAMCVCANLMDDELREELHEEDWPKGIEGERAFLAAYCVAHAKKFGEEFVVN